MIPTISFLYYFFYKDFEEKVNTGNVTEGMTQDTDGSFLSLSSLKERFQQIRRSARFTSKIKRPNRLVEVRGFVFLLYSFDI